jgi:hypothetical protein
MHSLRKSLITNFKGKKPCCFRNENISAQKNIITKCQTNIPLEAINWCKK